MMTGNGLSCSGEERVLSHATIFLWPWANQSRECTPTDDSDYRSDITGAGRLADGFYRWGLCGCTAKSTKYPHLCAASLCWTDSNSDPDSYTNYQDYRCRMPRHR